MNLAGLAHRRERVRDWPNVTPYQRSPALKALEGGLACYRR